MSLFKNIFKGIVGHYSYDDNYLTKLLEDEKKEQHLRQLVEISDKIMDENPNFVDEVKKSETGCWMDQVYGTHVCKICDFLDDCPIHLEEEWQSYLGTLSPEERERMTQMVGQRQANGGTMGQLGAS
jgi:hypothetical protein